MKPILCVSIAVAALTVAGAASAQVASVPKPPTPPVPVPSVTTPPVIIPPIRTPPVPVPMPPSLIPGAPAVVAPESDRGASGSADAEGSTPVNGGRSGLEVSADADAGRQASEDQSRGASPRGAQRAEEDPD